MSRAQYFTYLRSSLEEGEPQATKSIPNSKKEDRDDEETKKKKNPTHYPLPMDDDETPPNPAAADKLSVGVCIFRLDGRTLSPAVLLLRRSPRWWRRRIFTSVGGRHSAGEWELPGGKVENDDFCISAAIERLVREKTGLRVTKIMFMLSDVRWREERKVLLWEEEEAGKSTTSGDSNEDGDSNGDGDDEVEIKVGLAAVADDVEWSSSIASSEDSVVNAAADDGNDGTTGIAHGSDEMISSRGKEEALMSLDLEALGIRFPVDSSSPASSGALLRLTMDSSGSGSSSVVSAPPVPPKDPGRYARGYREHSNDHADEYHADHERDNNCHRYESNKDHDPSSLKPAPLSLPSRKPNKLLLPLPRHQYRKTTEGSSTSSTAAAALPTQASLLEHMDMHTLHWRDAQMIPYKMVRKEYVQLNFTVLVDEPEPHTNDEHEPLPEFLRRRRHAHADADGKEICEHDALEWATCARLKKLPMSEDLRRVVFEGLAWMGTLTGGFF
ncbi:hypothetical protein F4860DRAFT_518509 [Xylaria cubensis]|nr:hypothetical protein F4860DRAFT_518509 [Xylaria cubensis]